MKGRIVKKPRQGPRGSIPAFFGPSGAQAFFPATNAGRPLPRDTRRHMESAFGVDFSEVRIHRGGQAAEMNRQLGAKAFTHKGDIFFNDGMFRPDTAPGQRLLAHELTHVVQQGHAPGLSRGMRRASSTAPAIQRAIQDVRHNELTTFFSQPENATVPHLLDKYLSEPGLMTAQRAVLADLAGQVQRGEAPLSAAELLQLAQQHESDLGTALIICHNITRALARGSAAIQWGNVSREPLVYSLAGTTFTFEPDQFHRDAVPISSRGEYSVFYAMLSDLEFGQQDEGDWYHYFAIAATTYYHLARGLSPDRPDPASDFTGQLIRTVANALRDSSVPSSAAYESWLIANAMSFLEGGAYGQDQSEVNRESDIHIQGASGALATQSRIPEDNWRWYVPRAGGISPQDLTNFQLREGDMVDRVRTGVSGNFDLYVVSGSTPDRWYDTPDPFVKLPGWMGSRTAHLTDTTSPSWNERLDTFSYPQLASVTLQLYDYDPILNDHIADFTGDLRPQGQTSQTFNLSSGSSTLEVRVEASGRILLANP